MDFTNFRSYIFEQKMLSIQPMFPTVEEALRVQRDRKRVYDREIKDITKTYNLPETRSKVKSKKEEIAKLEKKIRFIEKELEDEETDDMERETYRKIMARTHANIQNKKKELKLSENKLNTIEKIIQNETKQLEDLNPYTDMTFIALSTIKEDFRVANHTTVEYEKEDLPSLRKTIRFLRHTSDRNSKVKKIVITSVYKNTQGNEREIKATLELGDPKLDATITSVLSDINKHTDVLRDMGIEFSDSFDTGPENYYFFDHIDIIFIKDTSLGVYHFECLNENQVSFDWRRPDKPIYTSKLQNNDCVFYILLAGLKKYAHIEKGNENNLEREINLFRLSRISNLKQRNDKVSHDHISDFFNFLRARGYTWTTTDKQGMKHRVTRVKTKFSCHSQIHKLSNETANKPSSDVELILNVFKHENHLFLANQKYGDYIIKTFIPYQILNNLSDEVFEPNYVELANITNIKHKTEGENDVGKDLIFHSYDIESQNKDNKQIPRYYGVLTIWRQKGEFKRAPFYYFKTLEEFEEYIQTFTSKIIFEAEDKESQGELRRNVYLGAWNGAPYDFPLTRFNKQIKKTRGANKNLDTYQFKGFQLRTVDTMKLTVGADQLKKACESFKVKDAKMNVEPEYFFECLDRHCEGKPTEWIPDQSIIERMKSKKKNPYEFEQVLLEYLEADCTSQAEIIEKFIKEQENSVFNLNPIRLTSNAGIAGHIINNKVKTKVDLFESNILNKYYQKAMYGGRTLMLAQYYKHMKDITLENWNEELKKTMTYIDAVSLYPSAMYLFKYPTKFLGAGTDLNQCNLQEILEYGNSVEHIDEILMKSKTTYICKATIRNPKGIVTVTSHREKGGLRHGHVGTHTGLFDLSTLLQSQYLNQSEIEIHEWYRFETGNIFDFVQTLFKMRLDFKAKNDITGSTMIKIILNSLYGKLCEKMFEEVNSSRVLNNKELIDIIRRGSQLLYVYKNFDDSGKLFHIASLVLSNSKWLMNRVIDTLGGKPGNFAENKYPFFGTDTDSLAVYVDDFLKSKEYLENTPIPINHSGLGGFHIDVEAPESADKNYQPLITEAVWICAKTYILKCLYVENGEIKVFYHRRAKGIPSGWIENFTCEDYLYLSQLENKEDRKVKAYAKQKYGVKKEWRFKLDMEEGTVEKDFEFDRAFPHISAIGKHRVFDQKKYEESLKTGKPIVLDPLNQPEKIVNNL